MNWQDYIKGLSAQQKDEILDALIKQAISKGTLGFFEGESEYQGVFTVNSYFYWKADGTDLVIEK